MSEFLNSLHTPDASAQSWAAEVAAAEAAQAAEAAAPAPEPVAEEKAADPAPAQEAAPEPSQPAPEATEDADRRVPLKALHEERQKRAEAERKIAEFERRMADLEQRTKPPEPPAEPEPDPETDPIGALKHAREELRRMREASAQQQREAQLNAIAYNSAVQFSQTAPDYRDAYQYAVKSRAQELAVLGADQNAIPEIIKREELSLVETAVRAGRNPAEAIYQFAKARGYNSPAPAASAPAPAPAAPDPALQQAKKAVAASASAGGAPATKGDLSDNDLANLKGAAFDAAWQKRFGGNKSSMFRE